MSNTMVRRDRLGAPAAERSRDPVLLAHTSSRRLRRYGTLERCAGRTAPLGLILLAMQMRADWLDFGDEPPAETHPDLAVLGAGTLVVRAASDWDAGVAARWLAALRRQAPRAKIVLAVPSPRGWSGWDGVLHGTGLGLSGGDDAAGLSGWPMIAPAAVLADGRPAPLPNLGGYRAGWFETGAQPAVEVFCPWLGLRERAGAEPWVPPPVGFLQRLCQNLATQRYRAVLFVVPPPPAELPAALVSWTAAAHEAGLRASWRLPLTAAVFEALRQLPDDVLPEYVWLVPPVAPPPASVVPAMQHLLERGVRLGLRCAAVTPAAWLAAPIVGLWHGVSFVEPGQWAPERLRATVWSAAITHGLWPKQFLGLRRLGDLVRLLRGTFALLNTLIQE